jgi:hypothetical protein
MQYRPVRRRLGLLFGTYIVVAGALIVASPAVQAADTPTPVPPPPLLHMTYVAATQLVLSSIGGHGETSGGVVEVDVSLRDGGMAGILNIPEFAGQALVYGFAPSAFVASFTQADLFTGAIALQPRQAAGVLTADYAANFSVKVLVLGVFPVNGGSSCKANSPISLHFVTDKGTDKDAVFDAFRGGRVTASFAIAPFSGCGRFDALLNSMVVRPGASNQLRLDLTPKK